jgi:hypothetical protein
MQSLLLKNTCLHVAFSAVGHVVMAEATATGDPLAIKFHSTRAARDTSFHVLKKLVNKVSRQFLVAPPANMSDTEVSGASDDMAVAGNTQCCLHMCWCASRQELCYASCFRHTCKCWQQQR